MNTSNQSGAYDRIFISSLYVGYLYIISFKYLRLATYMNPMKVHYAADSTKPLACKKPIRWNTEITDEIDALTCETCIRRVKNLILSDFPKAKDGKGIFITSRDKSPLTIELLKKNRELLALQQELDFANNCIRKAMAVPDYDWAVKMVQNELVPYVCKYQRT